MLSCIIPIYKFKIEESNKLFESLLEQEKSIDVEYIFIENGEKSEFENFCKDKIKEINYKYFYLTKANVSNARNIGIEKSSGEYITFIDSDDYVEKNWLKEISKNLKFDLLFFDFYFIDNKKVVNDYEFYNVTKETVFRSILSSRYLRGYLWNKVFKKDIIIENNIKLNEKLSFCEDLDFVVRYFAKCKTFKYLKYTLYDYVKNPNSITNSKKLSIYLDVLKVRFSFIEKATLDQKYFCKISFCKCYSNALALANREQRKKIREEYRDKFDLSKKEVKVDSIKVFCYVHPLAYKILHSIWQLVFK